LACTHTRPTAIYTLSLLDALPISSELDAAARVAADLGAVAHKVVRVDLRSIGGSALTDDIAVPEAPGEGIPVTYVPARNTIMLRSEEHTSELQSRENLVCRLLLEK